MVDTVVHYNIEVIVLPWVFYLSLQNSGNTFQKINEGWLYF